MLRIMIADDHPIIRQGLRQPIAKTNDIAITEEASNGWEVLSKPRASHCDVVVLDISMPGLHGLDIIRQLKNESPRLPILILSIHSEEQYAVRAFRAGASGYLTKGSAPDELLGAIRKVSMGEKYVSSSLGKIWLRTWKSVPDNYPTRLSPSVSIRLCAQLWKSSAQMGHIEDITLWTLWGLLCLVARSEEIRNHYEHENPD